uniref:Uncharacterized protein n=1 Tax=Arion vulgaris TaxID=1028688 RepID=A0A0B6Z496_9EUPU
MATFDLRLINLLINQCSSEALRKCGCKHYKSVILSASMSVRARCNAVIACGP